MQVRVESGRGYQPGDMRAFRDDYSKQTIGRIIMDASFSPVRRVCLLGVRPPAWPSAPTSTSSR